MEVILYTKPNCKSCVKVKEFLNENKINYVEYDISEDADREIEMIVKSNQICVPVLDVDGRIVVGWQERKLKEIFQEFLNL